MNETLFQEIFFGIFLVILACIGPTLSKSFEESIVGRKTPKKVK